MSSFSSLTCVGIMSTDSVQHMLNEPGIKLHRPFVHVSRKNYVSYYHQLDDLLQYVDRVLPARLFLVPTFAI